MHTRTPCRPGAEARAVEKYAPIQAHTQVRTHMNDRESDRPGAVSFQDTKQQTFSEIPDGSACL
eukprot:1161321-Pelagomonas_calceolata.AAC.3